MEAEAILKEWVAQSPSSWTDLELRLLRRVPQWASKMKPFIHDPIEQALAGVGPIPQASENLADRVRIALAISDAGKANEAVKMRQLEMEAEASGDPHLWLTAARLHVEVSPAREAEARMALSDQVLPYVFPGEIDTRMVHVLSAGERVLPALHVDWVRKLTTWLTPAISSDCKHGGLWFWPVIRILDAGKLKRPLLKLANVRLPPGGYGLASVYCRRIGMDGGPLLDAGQRVDQQIAALAFLGDATR